MQAAAAAGERDVARLLTAGRTTIDADQLQYLEIRAADDLTSLTTLDRPARVFAAARYGATRLIDNMAIPDSK